MRISDWSSDVCSSDLLGAKTVYTDDSQINAVLTREGKATWIEVDADDNLNEVHVMVVHQQPVKLSLIAPSGNDYRLLGRSEERRVGKECVSTCSCRGSTSH